MLLEASLLMGGVGARRRRWIVCLMSWAMPHPRRYAESLALWNGIPWENRVQQQRVFFENQDSAIMEWG